MLFYNSPYFCRSFEYRKFEETNRPETIKRFLQIQKVYESGLVGKASK